MKRKTEDKVAVGVGLVAIGLVILAILLKLAVFGLVVWGLYEAAKYLSTLT